MIERLKIGPDIKSIPYAKPFVNKSDAFKQWCELQTGPLVDNCLTSVFDKPDFPYGSISKMARFNVDQDAQFKFVDQFNSTNMDDAKLTIQLLNQTWQPRHPSANNTELAIEKLKTITALKNKKQTETDHQAVQFMFFQNTLTEQNEKLKTENKKLEIELADLKSKITDLNAEIATAGVSQQEIATLTERFTEELQTNILSYNDLKDSYNKIIKLNHELNVENTRLRVPQNETITEITVQHEQQITELKNQIDKLLAENKKLNADKQNLKVVLDGNITGRHEFKTKYSLLERKANSVISQAARNSTAGNSHEIMSRYYSPQQSLSNSETNRGGGRSDSLSTQHNPRFIAETRNGDQPQIESSNHTSIDLDHQIRSYFSDQIYNELIQRTPENPLLGQYFIIENETVTFLPDNTKELLAFLKHVHKTFNGFHPATNMTLNQGQLIVSAVEETDDNAPSSSFTIGDTDGTHHNKLMDCVREMVNNTSNLLIPISRRGTNS